MIALLSLAVAAGLVLALYALYRRWLLARRAPGATLQEVVRPTSAETQFWVMGLVAVVSLMVLLLTDPPSFEGRWWGLVLVFAVAVFEAACWVSGVYQFAFHEKGLWYGRSWYDYQDVQSLEIDRDRVSLFVKGRVISFRTIGSLAAEVRAKLTLARGA